MSHKMISTIHRIATGSSKKRNLYTPFAGLFFLTVTSGFVILPIYLDRILNILPFVYNPWNLIISVPLLAAGLFYVIWSIVIFFGVRGTPVPLNPPPVLVVKGPYKYSRNPMTAGLFLQMFGVGFLFGSALSILVFTQSRTERAIGFRERNARVCIRFCYPRLTVLRRNWNRI